MTRGLLTGSNVAVLGATSNMLWTVNYYDRDGRVVKIFKQHYKGGTLVAGNYDEISNTYDFTGAVVTSNRSHKVTGTEQLKVLNEYSYDHGGRKIDTWQTINTGPRILLSRLEPDELNQLYKKNLYSTNGGTSFLQTVTYKYNFRHWLKSIDASLLSMTMEYYRPDMSASNGNISKIVYTGTNSGTRTFNYTYDGLNRLTKSQYSNADQLSEEIAYDKAGNITVLKRGAPTNPATYYSYANGGMSNVLSATSGPVSGSFSYDGNGNAISDGSRNITSIAYNELNLPSTVTATVSGVPTQVAAYTYDASGTKLKSVQGAIAREYISGIQYTNGVIDFVATEEGRAVRNPSTGAYSYEYSLKDHLGNARVSFDDNNGVARLIQEDEYYAFGLNRSLFNSGTKNNYLYNGKELQTALSEEYDYGARFYDPVIGRWTAVDPSADEAEQETFSPYSYVFNNPVKNTDPDGRIPNIDPPSAKTVIKTVAIGTGAYAGGVLAASLVAGGAVAAGGTATIVGAPIGWAVGAGIIVGGAATAGVMWLADKITETAVQSTETTPNGNSEGKRRQNRLPDTGEPNTTKTNDPGTTTKVYGPDGNVQKEHNKGHGPNWPKKSERGDHVHDHKPNTNPNDPKPTDRQTGRKPKPNELEKDKVKQENRRNNLN